jgi:hypothetical protein
LGAIEKVVARRGDMSHVTRFFRNFKTEVQVELEEAADPAPPKSLTPTFPKFQNF